MNWSDLWRFGEWCHCIGLNELSESLRSQLKTDFSSQSSNKHTLARCNKNQLGSLLIKESTSSKTASWIETHPVPPPTWWALGSILEHQDEKWHSLRSPPLMMTLSWRSHFFPSHQPAGASHFWLSKYERGNFESMIENWQNLSKSQYLDKRILKKNKYGVSVDWSLWVWGPESSKDCPLSLSPPEPQPLRRHFMCLTPGQSSTTLYHQSTTLWRRILSWFR